jgi:hypothetical protein
LVAEGEEKSVEVPWQPTPDATNLNLDWIQRERVAVGCIRAGEFDYVPLGYVMTYSGAKKYLVSHQVCKFSHFVCHS